MTSIQCFDVEMCEICSACIVKYMYIFLI